MTLVEKLGKILFKVPEDYTVAGLGDDPQAVRSILLAMADYMEGQPECFGTSDGIQSDFYRLAQELKKMTEEIK